MKVKSLSPYTREAIARTLGSVEGRNRSAPTWDGSVLHIARLRVEWHVLHEVAHWICSKPEHRRLPNYGLGTDRDGGPKTQLFLEDDLKSGRADAVAKELYALVKTAPDLLLSILKEKLSREEEVAALVSIVLTRLQGGPWKMEINRVYKVHEWPERAEALAARFWDLLDEAASRGIDIEDPLRPFAGRARRSA